MILGTRHCSLLHQQIIELLSYALVLSDNHIYTSGATGTHAAAIRGALRADNQELLTVILPQTVLKQPREIRDLLGEVIANTLTLTLTPEPNPNPNRNPTLTLALTLIPGEAGHRAWAQPGPPRH